MKGKKKENWNILLKDLKGHISMKM